MEGLLSMGLTPSSLEDTWLKERRQKLGQVPEEALLGSWIYTILVLADTSVINTKKNYMFLICFIIISLGST